MEKVKLNKDKYGFIVATGTTHYGTSTQVYNIHKSPLRDIVNGISIHFHIKLTKKFIKEMEINSTYLF